MGWNLNGTVQILYKYFETTNILKTYQKFVHLLISASVVELLWTWFTLVRSLVMSGTALTSTLTLHGSINKRIDYRGRYFCIYIITFSENGIIKQHITSYKLQYCRLNYLFSLFLDFWHFFLTQLRIIATVMIINVAARTSEMMK